MIYPDDPLPELPDPEVAALRARVLRLEGMHRQLWDMLVELRLTLATQEHA